MNETRVTQRMVNLCNAFQEYVEYYDTNTPFTAPGQLDYHRQTIERRRKLGSVRASVQDMEFVELLWKTLDRWGMNSRSARLVPLNQLSTSLRDNISALESLEHLQIDDPDLDRVDTAECIWSNIEKVQVTPSENKVVSGTKALHHLLLELIPPMDRQYTRVFFDWRRVEFQYNPRDAFIDMYVKCAEIAGRTEPAQYVGVGWRTSRTKILDNAIVAFCLVHKLRPD